MPRKTYKEEEIIRKLREAEVLSSQGLGVDEVVRRIEVTKNTYYRWRKEYGGLRVDQAKRMKDLEKENGRLKKLVADQALDIQILKEAASGN
jgi:putative transposase